MGTEHGGPETALMALVAAEAWRTRLAAAFGSRELSALAMTLSELIFGEDRDLAEAAASCLEPALSEASAPELRRLERCYRSARFHRRWGGVVHVETLGPLEPSTSRSIRMSKLALSSVQRHGPVREDATHRLARHESPLAVGLLLLRLNDPVSQVRSAARTGLQRWLSADRLDAWVRWLPLVDSLHEWERTKASDVPQALEALVRARPEPVLEATRVHSDRWVRLSGLRMLGRVAPDAPSLLAMLRTGLADSDPAIRHWAAQATVDRDRTPDEVRAEMLPIMATDRAPRIRIAALRWLVRQPDPAPHIERAAFDPNAGVRHLARRYAARRSLSIPHRQRALDLLAESPDPGATVGALAVLSEFGRVSDAAVVRPFLDHSLASVRREAERTSALLAGRG